MERKLTPPEEITENIFEMNADERAACGIEDLPDSLEHALDALEADPLMAEVLGPHIYTQYIAGKEKRVGGVLHPRFQLGNRKIHGPLLTEVPQTGRNRVGFPGFL